MSAVQNLVVLHWKYYIGNIERLGILHWEYYIGNITWEYYMGILKDNLPCHLLSFTFELDSEIENHVGNYQSLGFVKSKSLMLVPGVPLKF